MKATDGGQALVHRTADKEADEVVINLNQSSCVFICAGVRHNIHQCLVLAQIKALDVQKQVQCLV
jgi:hypothetical protein